MGSCAVQYQMKTWNKATLASATHRNTMRGSKGGTSKGPTSGRKQGHATQICLQRRSKEHYAGPGFLVLTTARQLFDVEYS